MSERLNGAELSRLILPDGTTAEQIASADLESLTRTVADMRDKWLVVRGDIDPALSDEAIAGSILEYAKGEPPDWPVPPDPPASACGQSVAGVLIGGLGGAVPGFLISVLAVSSVHTGWGSDPVRFFGEMFYMLGGLVSGAILGGLAGLVAASVVRPRWARIPAALLAGFVVSALLVRGWWWWKLSP
jgi:hypothetical protein